MIETDVRIRNEGSMIGFFPVNEKASKWFTENVDSEPWQWLGLWLYVDHHMAQPVIEGLQNAGFTVEEDA